MTAPPRPKRARPRMSSTGVSLRHGIFWCTLAGTVAAQGTGPETDATVPPIPPGAAYVNTADPAVPDAREVVVDVPSAFHWSRYQVGDLGPWTYVFYPDGTGKILDRAERPKVLATLDCTAGESCVVAKPDGPGFSVDVGRGERPTPPETTDLDSTARYLAQWLLAGTAPPPPPPPPEPDPEPAVSTDAADSGLTGATPEPAAEVPPPESEPEPDTAPATEDVIPDVTRNEPPIGEEPVCPQQDPFLPASCLQPTTPLEPRAAPDPEATPTPPPQSPDAPTGPVAPPQTATPSAPPAAETPPPDDAPKKKVRFVDRINLACSITGNASLQFTPPGSTKKQFGKPRASIGCSANLTDRLSVRFSQIGYGNSKEQQPWDPDYTYAFTYRVNDNITLGYSNYSARFSDPNAAVAGLLEGNIRANIKLPVLTLPNGKTLPCSLSAGFPKVAEESLNLSCGYAVTKRLRVSGTMNFHAPGQQGTYEPDYSYTASYRINEDWYVSYNNYSNNRWPWNKGEAPGPGVLGGSISVGYRIRF